VCLVVRFGLRSIARDWARVKMRWNCFLGLVSPQLLQILVWSEEVDDRSSCLLLGCVGLGTNVPSVLGRLLLGCMGFFLKI